MPTKLILIRHGQTDYNLNRRYCGFSDVDLNDTGKRQAQKLSRRLADEKICRIYSSDLKRTARFAAIAAAGRPIKKVRGLREINFGIFEGMTHKEIMKAHRRPYQAWLSDPVSTVIPEGESLKNTATRVKKAVQKILTKNRGKTVLVFTHAGPIRIIIAGILKIGLKDAWRIEQDSAAVNVIEFSGKKAKILLRNDTEHLKKRDVSRKARQGRKEKLKRINGLCELCAFARNLNFSNAKH